MAKSIQSLHDSEDTLMREEEVVKADLNVADELMSDAKERFSFECCKTKTKVITLANHKEHRQYSEPIKTRSNYM